MYVLDPLHDYAVVLALPNVMQRIQLRDPDAPLPTVTSTGKVATGAGQTGRIIMPDTVAFDGAPADSGTGKTGGRGGAVTTLLVGMVLTVGPGKHREGMFIAPTVKPGDMVLFMPRTVSYEFRLHGHSIKIVPYHELVSAVREVAADGAEWRAFVALVEGALKQSAQLPAAEAV